MIPTERRIESIGKAVRTKIGYFLTVGQIVKLCRDFNADQRDGFVSNDEAYVKLKMEEMEE